MIVKLTITAETRQDLAVTYDLLFKQRIKCTLTTYQYFTPLCKRGGSASLVLS